MSMNIGGKGIKAEMNVTPMIDVLLVLIVIFLVIMPTDSQGLAVLTPQQSDQPQPAPVRQEIVVTLGKDGAVEINHQPVELEALAARLVGLRGTTDHIFIRGDRELDYQA